MEAIDKLRMLSSACQLETADDESHSDAQGSLAGVILSHAILPNGKRIPLLKSLLTSVCENNCYYCPMRSGRDFRRTTFLPEDFAKIAVRLTRAGLIQGIFLSSGVVGGGIQTQDRMIAAAEILRNTYQYNQYLHIKIMPGAQFDQILACMRLADRVSINLEAPNASRLEKLAPRKDFEYELMRSIQAIHHIRIEFSPALTKNNRWPSASTQFVVGGAEESDVELITSAETLHHRYHFSRVYYSPLSPQADTPFSNHTPIPLARQHRLYQADFLIRDYGYTLNDLFFNEDGMLPLSSDPKKIWAEHNLIHQPVEINRASRIELMRIPGIGPKYAEMIMKVRKWNTIQDLSTLKKIGVHVEVTKKFIMLNGKRPIRQLSLFY